MKKPRYRIYDTLRRDWLCQLVTMPTDDGDMAIIGVVWCNDPAEALLFPGVKSAARVVDRLGDWSELVITRQQVTGNRQQSDGWEDEALGNRH